MEQGLPLFSDMPGDLEGGGFSGFTSYKEQKNQENYERKNIRKNADLSHLN